MLLAQTIYKGSISLETVEESRAPLLDGRLVQRNLVIIPNPIPDDFDANLALVGTDPICLAPFPDLLCLNSTLLLALFNCGSLLATRIQQSILLMACRTDLLQLLEKRHLLLPQVFNLLEESLLTLLLLLDFDRHSHSQLHALLDLICEATLFSPVG